MSEENLISKKDLLIEANISYGQLYRWKRKDLIPEEWFIRKSTFTGQETFFPKTEILERIAKIQEMKDNLSLDELASYFSPSGGGQAFEADGSAIGALISKTVQDLYFQETGRETGSLDFDQMLGLYVVENLLQSGDVNLEEAKMVLKLIQDHYVQTLEKAGKIFITRKMGVSTCLLVGKTDRVYFDGQAKVAAQVDLIKSAQALKAKLV